MKKILLIIVCLIGTAAFAQDNSKLILGTWVYSDVYEREKADAETLKMAEVLFAEMEFVFTETTLTLNMMGKSESAPWNFSKTNPNIIETTSKKGKPVQVEIIKLAENELIVKMGATGTLIMKKKV